MTALDTYACRVHVGPRIVACIVCSAMPAPSSSATLSARKILPMHSNVPRSDGSVCESGRKGRVRSAQRPRQPRQQKRLCTNVFTVKTDTRVEIKKTSEPCSCRRRRLASRWHWFEGVPFATNISTTPLGRCRRGPSETSRCLTDRSDYPRCLGSLRRSDGQISIRPASETHHTVPSPPPTGPLTSILPTPDAPSLPPVVFCSDDSSQDGRTCLDMGVERANRLCRKTLEENEYGRL